MPFFGELLSACCIPSGRLCDPGCQSESYDPHQAERVGECIRSGLVGSGPSQASFRIYCRLGVLRDSWARSIFSRVGNCKQQVARIARISINLCPHLSFFSIWPQIHGPASSINSTIPSSRHLFFRLINCLPATIRAEEATSSLPHCRLILHNQHDIT
jgi:hypothetical protein